MSGAAAEPRERGVAIVFSELLDNQSFCAAIVRELSAHYEVRPCGPGWPIERLEQVDCEGARFFLELDSASGSFVRPQGLERLTCPRFAWLIDTHKKPEHHRQIARQIDLTFFAMRAWGHLFEGPSAWLPLHADPTLFFPQERERDLDLVFVGSQTWRADPLRELARRHGLRVEITTTTGPCEKSETAALYARSKLVFNRHVTNDLNFRVFEATACGRVLLTDAQANGQYELFQDDRQLVYYKDDHDLERQVLRLLGDDALRSRIEAEAAALTAERHTTRARVGQLVDSIEAWIAREERPALALAAAIPEVAAPRDEPLPSGRWLVVAGPEPEAVWLASWAERVAHDLRGLGQEVVLVRHARGARSERTSQLREVPLGPAPPALTASNQLLMRAVALQRRLAQVAEEEGPFQAILVEGALGALVGPPLAARLELPLVLLLGDCEVLRRGNRLTREELYLAELEHWGAERAARVLAPRDEVLDALTRHYALREPRLLPVSTRGPVALADAERLLARLGVGRPPVVVLGSELGAPEREALLTRPPASPLVLAGQGLFLAEGGQVRRLAEHAPSGPALGALLAGTNVLLADRAAERRADARALAARTAEVGRGRGPIAWDQALAADRPPEGGPDVDLALRSLVRGVLPAAARARADAGAPVGVQP